VGSVRQLKTSRARTLFIIFDHYFRGCYIQTAYLISRRKSWSPYQQRCMYYLPHIPYSKYEKVIDNDISLCQDFLENEKLKKFESSFSLPQFGDDGERLKSAKDLIRLTTSTKSCERQAVAMVIRRQRHCLLTLLGTCAPSPHLHLCKSLSPHAREAPTTTNRLYPNDASLSSSIHDSK
jgi:hypothetical protein